MSLDRKLIADCQKQAGAQIHEVCGCLSGYLNQTDNAAFYDRIGEFSEEANAVRKQALYYERVLRSFLVTGNLEESKRIVRQDMCLR